MFEKLEEVERRYETLYHLLGQPEVISKHDELQRVAKEYAELRKVVDLYRKFKKLDVEIEESRHLLSSEEDDEMKRLALKGLLIVQSAGGVTRISWPYKNMEELADVLTHG